MDKEMYKQLTAEYMRREAKLLITVSELKDKIESLEKHRLELIMENAELKDMVLDNGGEYAETDGYEVGSPSDYEEDKQLSFDFEIIKTSDSDFEVNHGRRAEDEVREQFNR